MQLITHNSMRRLERLNPSSDLGCTGSRARASYLP
jgi:hypothetical protein